ncbi:MurR/RpiR family transcriptional regulator [Spiroplasma alleghenense]|uniref:HTH rpiR-type domain-containing protein n=1 Tax=Spiroplasma alleghenense TaxID=216931 RepID=A0A345Z4V6_9MOLU|nr:MurR/RpiR family transcriptional regulator [Spiroplasma alleghenense]AXK51635.1 hypothetical protein SALLE_v1c09650 [Spiroplasma alleghenense]
MKSVRENLINYNKVTTNELYKMICEFIIEQITLKNYPSMQEVAWSAFTTKSTVTRFCNQLGYTGYKELIYTLKNQDNNYYQNLDKVINASSSAGFQEYKKQLINDLNQFDQQITSIIALSEKINQAKNIYMFFSYEVEDTAKILIDFLQIINKNLFFSKSRKNMSVMLDNIKSDDLVLFVVAGMDNAYLENMFSLIKKDFSNTAVVSSISQFHKFDDCDLKITIDASVDKVIIYNKEIHLNYLFRQIINYLVSNNEKLLKTLNDQKYAF